MRCASNIKRINLDRTVCIDRLSKSVFNSLEILLNHFQIIKICHLRPIGIETYAVGNQITVT